MDQRNETAHKANEVVDKAEFDPFAPVNMTIEAHASDFNLFDILPDECAPVRKPVAVVQAVPVPAQAPKKHGGGPKRKYDPSIVVPMVCNIIASCDKGLSEICADRRYFPHHKQVLKWLITSQELSDKYARAKEKQADFMADQIRQLSDQCRLGEVVTTKTAADGTVTTETRTADMVERTRLQIDARKWLAAKLAPKKYGDRLQVQQNITVETPEQQIARLTGCTLSAIDITAECLRIEE